VGFQAGMKAVCGKQFQGRMKVFGDMRMFFENFLGPANESAGAQ
jgi:hypothetical protein